MAKQPEVSVTGRILSVLAAFEASGKPLGIAEIAEKTGLPTSTCYRMVGDLEQWGALDKTTDGRYQVGARIWELGQHASLSQREHLARPFLQDLFDLVHENVHMAVRQGSSAMYVDKIYGSRKLPLLSRIGSRLPLHSTAVGRVLLAAEPAWFINGYLDKKLVAPTSKTTLDRSELEVELRQAARQGYSMTIDQMRVGASSIAVPVVVQGETIAAVGIVMEGASREALYQMLPILRGCVERMQVALTAPNKRAKLAGK